MDYALRLLPEYISCGVLKHIYTDFFWFTVHCCDTDRYRLSGGTNSSNGYLEVLKNHTWYENHKLNLQLYLQRNPL